MRIHRSKEWQHLRYPRSRPFNNINHALDHEPLNLVLDGPDLSHEVASLVGGDASSDHRTRDTGRPAQSKLAGHEDIRSILVFTKKGDVQKDSERIGVRSEDDDFRGTTIECLGRFVCSLLQLTVVRSLLHKVQEVLGEALVGQRPSYKVIETLVPDRKALNRGTNPATTDSKTRTHRH